MPATTRLLLSIVVCALSASLAQADAALRALQRLPESTGAATPGEPMTAWVPVARMSANRLIQPGTVLFASASETSSPVHTFQAGDGMALQRVDAGWAQVRVYPALATPAGSTDSSSFTQSSGGAPVISEVVALDRASASTEGSAAQVAINPPPLVVSAPAPARRAAVEPTPANRVETIRVSSPVRVFSGTLLRTRGFLFTRPPAQFELVDSEGYRIAFVDLAQLMRTADLERVLRRPVQVNGRAVAVRDGRDTLITAETLVILR